MSTPVGLCNSEGGQDEPVVLRTSMILDEMLSKAYIWSSEPELVHSLPSSLGLLQTALEKRLFTDFLAPLLLSQRGYVPGVHDANYTSIEHGVLSVLVGRLLHTALASKEGNVHHFTELGKNRLVVGQLLVGGRMACARPNLRRIPAHELTVFEMMRLLHQEGWQRLEASSRRERGEARKAAYNGGRDGCSGKIFYTINKHDSICNFYLQALVAWPEHEKAVPHLAPSADYKTLLGIPVKQAARRKAPEAALVSEDWPALENGEETSSYNACVCTRVL